MAERISAIDPAVDELRRKARRRLVGAIVLALAAAVLLPMLLEKEPRPLGEDVSVRIPPVDQGKFVNRLSPQPPAGKSESAQPSGASPASTNSGVSATPSASSAAPVAPVPGKSDVAKSSPADASPSTTPAVDVTPNAPNSQSENPAQPNTASAPATPVAKAEPKSPPAVEGASEAKSPAKSPATVQAATPAKAKPAEGSYVVQLAAFSDDKGANALASKLKRNGYPAYTEATQTSHGTLYRVRVGGYPSREAAGDARNKLKGDGYAGIVAPAH